MRTEESLQLNSEDKTPNAFMKKMVFKNEQKELNMNGKKAKIVSKRQARAASEKAPEFENFRLSTYPLMFKEQSASKDTLSKNTDATNVAADIPPGSQIVTPIPHLRNAAASLTQISNSTPSMVALVPQPYNFETSLPQESNNVASVPQDTNAVFPLQSPVEKLVPSPLQNSIPLPPPPNGDVVFPISTSPIASGMPRNRFPAGASLPSPLLDGNYIVNSVSTPSPYNRDATLSSSSEPSNILTVELIKLNSTPTILGFTNDGNIELIWEPKNETTSSSTNYALSSPIHTISNVMPMMAENLGLNTQTLTNRLNETDTLINVFQNLFSKFDFIDQMKIDINAANNFINCLINEILADIEKTGGLQPMSTPRKYCNELEFQNFFRDNPKTVVFGLSQYVMRPFNSVPNPPPPLKPTDFEPVPPQHHPLKPTLMGSPAFKPLPAQPPPRVPPFENFVDKPVPGERQFFEPPFSAPLPAGNPPFGSISNKRPPIGPPPFAPPFNRPYPGKAPIPNPPFFMQPPMQNSFFSSPNFRDKKKEVPDDSVDVSSFPDELSTLSTTSPTILRTENKR